MEEKIKLVELKLNTFNDNVMVQINDPIKKYFEQYEASLSSILDIIRKYKINFGKKITIKSYVVIDKRGDIHINTKGNFKLKEIEPNFTQVCCEAINVLITQMFMKGLEDMQSQETP